MKRLRLLIVGALFAATSWAIAGPPDVAQAAAESWLKLRDSGNFEAAWKESARFFRETTTKETWMEGAPRVQLYLGDVVSRKVRSVEYVDRLPGYPGGKHAIVEFDTSFERKGKSVEVIVMMLENDGVWRVSAAN